MSVFMADRDLSVFCFVDKNYRKHWKAGTDKKDNEERLKLMSDILFWSEKTLLEQQGKSISFWISVSDL